MSTLSTAQRREAMRAVPGSTLRRESGSAVDSVAPGSRIVRFVFSDGSVDRMNDTLDPAGWDLQAFKKNPVALWAHDSSQPPIGRVVDVGQVGNRLMGSIEFASADLNPLAETVYRMVIAGYVSACSVGFAPIEWKRSSDPERPGGIDYTRQELLEISVVPVPALASALVAAKAAGLPTEPISAWAAGRASPSNTKGISMAKNAAAVRAPTITRPGGFKSLGENLIAIARAARGGERDYRLTRAPIGMGETDPGTGGFLVADQFASELLFGAYEAAAIAPLCDRRETDNPLATVKIPSIDETSRADGSRWGGALAYWAAEGATVAATLPRFKRLEISPKKLIGLVYGTDELMSDVSMFDAHVRRVFAAEMAFKIDDAILAGSGAGKPQGIMASPSLITVPKVVGQAAATIVPANISSMYAALPAPSRRRAVWLCHEDVENALDTSTAAGGADAGFFVPAGVFGNSYPLLKGRPLIAVEQAQPVGTPGDIVLADLDHYILVDGGMKTVLSADVLFATDQIIFRFTLRIDGQSAFTSPITPYHGATLRSPFVALAAR